MTKITIILFIIIFSSLISFSQNDEKPNPDVMYGCIELNDTTQFKQTVVTVGDWFSYLYDEFDGGMEKEKDFDSNYMIPKFLKENYKKELEIFYRNWIDETGNPYEGGKLVLYKETYRPFTLVLTKEEKKTYKEFKKLLDMPITGLKFETVKRYLEWKWMYIIEDLNYLDAGYDMTMTLPTEEEYDKLINEYKNHLSTVKNKKGENTAIGDSVNVKGCHLYNFKGSENCPAAEHRLKYYGTLTGIVGGYSYNPDLNGIFCLLGNVAEMTSTYGIAKGGHYKMYAKEILENKPLIYRHEDDDTLGEDLIGFRYVIRLTKRKE